MGMKVAVIGSRTFKDRDLMFTTLDQIAGISTVVSGGAPGADRLAEEYAKTRKLNLTVHLAEWNNIEHPEATVRVKFGRKYDANAGYRRNKTIVNESDLVVAFWDGKSNGTNHAMKYARKINKEVKEVLFEPELTVKKDNFKIGI